GPYGVTEEHDGEDEPGSGRANGLFDDSFDVVNGAGEVAEDNRRRTPVGNKGEHHAADNDHLGSTHEAAASCRCTSLCHIRNPWTCSRERTAPFLGVLTSVPSQLSRAFFGSPTGLADGRELESAPVGRSDLGPAGRSNGPLVGSPVPFTRR